MSNETSAAHVQIKRIVSATVGPGAGLSTREHREDSCSGQMKTSSALQSAIRHIEEKWTEGEKLHAIAARYNVDTGNLVRAFRGKHELTPKQFMDEQRKQLVLREIQKDHALGYEIGAMIGMDDLAFYRWVKRAFGKSFEKLMEQQR